MLTPHIMKEDETKKANKRIKDWKARIKNTMMKARQVAKKKND